MYVLKLTQHNGSYPPGYYVSLPGSRGSYTKYLQCARTFQTREDAQGNACGNESVASVADEMK